MGYLILKSMLTGCLVVLISLMARRSSVLAALLASLPLTSILAFVWLYQESPEVEPIARLSQGIFWMVIPSLAFFLIFPALLKTGLRFYPSLLIASISTAVVYAVFMGIARRLNLSI